MSLCATCEGNGGEFVEKQWVQCTTCDDKHVPMTVGELRMYLNTLDDDVPVVLEGCDCVGEAKCIEMTTWNSGQAVLITRYL